MCHWDQWWVWMALSVKQFTSNPEGNVERRQEAGNEKLELQNLVRLWWQAVEGRFQHGSV